MELASEDGEPCDSAELRGCGQGVERGKGAGDVTPLSI